MPTPGHGTRTRTRNPGPRPTPNAEPPARPACVTRRSSVFTGSGGSQESERASHGTAGPSDVGCQGHPTHCNHVASAANTPRPHTTAALPARLPALLLTPAPHSVKTGVPDDSARPPAFARVVSVALSLSRAPACSSALPLPRRSLTHSHPDTAPCFPRESLTRYTLHRVLVRVARVLNRAVPCGRLCACALPPPSAAGPSRPRAARPPYIYNRAVTGQ